MPDLGFVDALKNVEYRCLFRLSCCTVAWYTARKSFTPACSISSSGVDGSVNIAETSWMRLGFALKSLAIPTLLFPCIAEVLSHPENLRRRRIVLANGSWKVDTKLFSVRQVQQLLLAKTILHLHCFSGCDNTSAIHGKSKVGIAKLFAASPGLIHDISAIFKDPSTPLEDIEQAGVKLFLAVYQATVQQDNLNKHRHSAFFKASTKPKSGMATLHPTRGASKQHSLRVYLQYFQTDLSSLLMSVVGGGPPTPDASGSSAQGGSRSQSSRRSSNRSRQHLPFENLLQQFIVNLTTNGVAGAQSATMSGPMMFLAGNPGDYAWGREGLDTIVTQLLNQMDGSGPPPLSQEQIGAVPFVNVSQQQLSTKLQCSVCWEDFILHESVRQLPCTHVYHENCILPWLQLHATCPICRKSLLTGSARDNDVLDTAQTLADMFHSIQSSPQGQPISVETHQETRANTSTGRSFRYIAPPERLGTELDIEQPTVTTTASSATNPSTGNRNNSDTLFDFNMDLEYD